MLALLLAAGAVALIGYGDLAAVLVVGFCIAWVPLLRRLRSEVGLGFEIGAYLCTAALLLFALDRLTEAPVIESMAFAIGTFGVLLVLIGALERLARRAARAL